MTMQSNIQKYPEELGRLFAKDGRNETFYGSAVRKFGIEKVSMKNASPRIKNGPTVLVATFHYLWLQLRVVSVIYHLLRRNVHDAST